MICSSGGHDVVGLHFLSSLIFLILKGGGGGGRIQIGCFDKEHLFIIFSMLQIKGGTSHKPPQIGGKVGKET